MLKRLMLTALLACFAAVWCSAAPAKGKTVFTNTQGKYKVVARTNCPDALAKVGDEVKIGVTVNSEQPGSFAAELFVNGVSQGKAKRFEFGKSADFAVKAATPGSVSVVCFFLDANKKTVLDGRKRKRIAGLGVRVSPGEIVPGNPKCPDDFDAFWKQKRAELDAVPLKATRADAKLKAFHTKKYPNVVCYDVKVDCAGGAPVSGYLCMPRGAAPKSLPAIVIYHGAGVRNSNMQARYGSKAIAFDVNAHGIENGKPQKFYDGLKAGALAGYWHRGFDDHNHIYFVGMFQRVMRALDYVKSLPEWDGKTLIVHGTSQGGGQTIVAAALDPQVTLAVAGVPALCDLGGQLANRRPGWPVYFMPPEKRTDAAIIRETAYIDGVFFAQRIKCPVYFSTGGIDNTCHAAAVYAAFNNLQVKAKQLVYNPVGHHGTSLCRAGLNEIDRQLGLKK